MRIQGASPKPWWQVGLTLLPVGAIWLANGILSGRAGWLVTIVVMTLAGASAIMVARARGDLFGLPVWASVALGFISFWGLQYALIPISSYRGPLGYFLILVVAAGLALVLLRWLLAAVPRRRFILAARVLAGLTAVTATLPLILLGGYGRFTHLQFYAACFLLVAVGLLFAKRHGPGAGLFVLAGILPMMSFDIEQVIYFWDHPFWGVYLEPAATILFYGLTPILVLRARSIGMQAAGLLLPVAAYFAVLVYALMDARGFTLLNAVSVADPAIVVLVTLAAASLFYAWIFSLSQTDKESELRAKPMTGAVLEVN